jgi:hypothetical protein
MLQDPLTLAGIVGTVFIVGAYFATQRGWLTALDWRYPLLNLVGALLILASLITAWNLPAAIMEAFWAAISIYGLIKSSTGRNQQKAC